ncbi:CPBP family intramembrane glutamic endopeptidase [Anaeromicropila herbilytica]|uniref:CAAX amino protease n=1 Tax=Anaeromicropila herbilytica TaxID=2785025 RepID=A0A7R7ELQ2_9FIRM|nr:CPBP family intramembrane glutamic endopeptidase [Anaeromicropila herbilytica]BCN30812.1 CAAX amino protease [Anaeromicropila herbilytica]
MLDLLVNAIVQVIVFSIIPLIWWMITTRNDENFFTWIGLKKPVLKGSMIKLFLIMLAVSCTYIFLMVMVMTQLLGDINTATSQFSNQGFNALPRILVYAIIQTGLSEEILFRGFLAKRLIHKFGFVSGNTIQACLFGLMHGLPFGIVTGNILVTIILTILPGTIGWVEGWMNEKYASGSIVPSWLMHSIMNILSALSIALG